MDVPDLRREPGPHVFVADLDAIVLADDDRHHLEKSLRLRAGDPFTVSDGRGRWRSALFGPTIEPASLVHTPDLPAYELTIGVALAKSGKPEFAVQKATELGIDHIMLFQAEHSVVRWDAAKRTKNVVRMQRVAREAAMQSRQLRIPQVSVVGSLAEAIVGRQVARADFVGTAPICDHRFVLIGPEGGWSEGERAMVPAAVELGPSVLRAETAAVVAAALLVDCRSYS